MASGVERSGWPERDPDHVLTWRQQRILHIISDFAKRRGYAPSLREIGEAAGLASTSSVSHQLSMLQAKGYLRRVAGRPRAIEVWLPGRPAVRVESQEVIDAASADTGDHARVPVPMVGQIVAGVPRRADEVIDFTWELPTELVGDGPVMLLRVHGDSMINALITDGDYVVVRQQEEAENGEMVAAMIDGEATVKTFRVTKGQVWLMPANPKYTPIPGEDAQILGKVVSMLRRV